MRVTVQTAENDSYCVGYQCDRDFRFGKAISLVLLNLASYCTLLQNICY